MRVECNNDAARGSRRHSSQRDVLPSSSLQISASKKRTLSSQISVKPVHLALSRAGFFLLTASLFLVPLEGGARLCAQQVSAASSSNEAASLTDSPGALLAGDLDPQAKANTAAPGPDVAKKSKRVIRAGQQAQPLSAGDKMGLSLLQRVSLSATAGSLFSAEFGNLRNGTPHYGVNLPAFGERFGAAEAKATSESFFSYGLYASIFHDDPRYYVMGPQEKFSKRAVYAATRVVITRKDDGRPAVNWPKLAGITSAAALTNAYYPDRDRQVSRTATSTLTSIGAAAGLNEAHEFLGDLIHHVFHKGSSSGTP